MKKLYFLILVSLFLAIGSSAYADTHHPIKVTLNIQAFPGFDVDKNKTDASLSGYEYQAIKGTPIKPESCNQTINIDSSTIADFEYFRFKQLIISCNAIKQFAKAMKAQTTYFPAKPDISFYSELPAMTKPLLTNNELKQLSHKTLGDYAPEINISLEMDSTAKIIISVTKMMKMKFMSPCLPEVTLPMMESKIYWLKQNGMPAKHLAGILIY